MLKWTKKGDYSLISQKNVIRMKVPFPSISDRLAVQAHMYICGEKELSLCGFVKCQTLKPYMLENELFSHYVDETADASRNPFLRTTRIDCDKLFVTNSVRYDIAMLTPLRPDVCVDLYETVMYELEKDGYEEININETELVSINPLISFC